jgi:hypothetical protein
MCCLLKVHQRFGGTIRLQLQGQRIIQTRNQREIAMPSTLKMEAAHFCEISVDFQLTTPRYIPEDTIPSF